MVNGFFYIYRPCSIVPFHKLFSFEATVTETDLQYFNVGDPVKIELIYLEDGEYAMDGTVEKISHIGQTSGEESGEASFTVYIIPAETEKLLYGMTALISRVQ